MLQLKKKEKERKMENKYKKKDKRDIKALSLQD
jgi:hypothetical protein